MITCLNSVAWQGNLGTYHMQHKFNIFYHFASKIPQFDFCRQNKNKRLFQWQKKGTKKLLLGEKARALNAMIPVIFKGHFSVSSCFRHGTAASFPQAKELLSFEKYINPLGNRSILPLQIILATACGAHDGVHVMLSS